MIKINETPLFINHFPDNSSLIKYAPKSITNVTIKWFFENNEELVTLIFVTNHLRALGASNIILKMPYIPNARQDRVKNSEDVFTLKYFAQIINSLKFDKVEVLDPHSSVSEALFENIIINSPKIYIQKAIDDIKRCNDVSNLQMFYPDEGAMKRYSGMINERYSFGIKKREWSTGKIVGLDVSGDIDSIKDNDILIVDDICSMGGTFYHSAKKLKSLGARKIFLYITHCENTIHKGQLLVENDLLEKIYTTDSIYTLADKKIQVFRIDGAV